MITENERHERGQRAGRRYVRKYLLPILVHARLGFLGSLMNSTELSWPMAECLRIVLQRLATSKLMAQT